MNILKFFRKKPQQELNSVVKSTYSQNSDDDCYRFLQNFLDGKEKYDEQSYTISHEISLEKDKIKVIVDYSKSRNCVALRVFSYEIQSHLFYWTLLDKQPDKSLNFLNEKYKIYDKLIQLTAKDTQSSQYKLLRASQIVEGYLNPQEKH